MNRRFPYSNALETDHCISVGYVEFREEESVQRALQLTGQKLAGIPIIVSLTEAEKNRQARNTDGNPTLSNGIPFHRLYVGNIHFSITEADLKQVFEPFGELEFVQLQKEETGRSKGYGFVQSVSPQICLFWTVSLTRIMQIHRSSASQRGSRNDEWVRARRTPYPRWAG